MFIDNFDLGNATFIIAEMSANHNQDFEIAVKTIIAAKESGVDAIKLQTYTADTLTINSDKNYFKIDHGTMWDGETLYNLYKKAYTPWEWHSKLKKVAEELGLIFFSTPFDPTAVDFLEKLGVSVYKIASPEITDIPLIKKVASKNLPIMISTGIAKLADIELAVETCRKVGNNKIILLKCTSAYPTPYDEVDLRTMVNLGEVFNTVIGLSDHTLGIAVPIAAVALGAKVIEKHFILDKSLGGVDSLFSIDPNEMKLLVQNVRNAEKSLGRVHYDINKKMKKIRELKRSLFIVKDVRKGEVFTEDNVRSIRPGFGLHPKYYDQIIGKYSSDNFEKGTPLNWKCLMY